MDSTGQRLKIFCVYFDSRPVWRSDCVEPIQAGRALTGTDLGMAADDTGDQISAENARYGEMTAWYWVWKNYLPRHPELEYVGFSHYRRFLDFSAPADGRTRRTTYSRFRAAFERHYGEEAVLKAVGDADLVMRGVADSGFATMREQFVFGHPELADDWDRFAALVAERHPGSSREIEETLGCGRLAMELQFVMRRELFVDFMEWAFSLCRECERRWGWGGATEGARARTPAFLIERFFLVWLAIRRSERPLKVKELPLVKLTGRPWWYRLARPFIALMPSAVQDRIYHKYK